MTKRPITRARRSKSRFFAHHPRTEKRSGPLSLRMTSAVLFVNFGDETLADGYFFPALLFIHRMVCLRDQILQRIES